MPTMDNQYMSYDEGALQTAGNAYVKGMNSRAEFLAGKIVKKPDDSATSSEYAKYKKDFLKWKARIKIAEILATGAIAIGPVDTALKALTVIGMSNSRAPEDRLIKQKLKGLTEKASAVKNAMNILKSKLKKKELNEAQLKQEINKIDLLTSHATKEGDAIKKLKFKKVDKKYTAKVSTESAVDINISDLDMFEEMTELTYELAKYAIESTDYMNDEAVNKISNYLDIACL